MIGRILIICIFEHVLEFIQIELLHAILQAKADIISYIVAQYSILDIFAPKFVNHIRQEHVWLEKTKQIMIVIFATAIASKPVGSLLIARIHFTFQHWTIGKLA